MKVFARSILVLAFLAAAVSIAGRINTLRKARAEADYDLRLPVDGKQAGDAARESAALIADFQASLAAAPAARSPQA